MSDARYAAIESGGTKILCAIADERGEVLAQTRIPTGLPEAAFAQIARFFGEGAAEFGPYRAGGVASFGPLDIDPDSPTYGQLTSTPKPGWTSVNMLHRIGAILGVPTAIDTDVNCAAMAEARHGAGRDAGRLCYVTIGTGIGIGVVDQGRPMLGAVHSEAGHSRVPRAAGDEVFDGVCPYHGDCLEGLASGPAIKARWGIDAEALGPDHIGWTYEAHYIACLCLNLSYTLRPQRIILGGGVMARADLIEQVRAAFEALMAGYGLDAWNRDAGRFICPPALVDPSPGIVGAIDLARDLISGPERA